MCFCVHTCVYMPVYVYIYMYMCERMWVHVCIYMCTYIMCTYMYMCVYKYVYIYICVCTCVSVYIWVYMYIAHTQRLRFPCSWISWSWSYRDYISDISFEESHPQGQPGSGNRPHPWPVRWQGHLLKAVAKKRDGGLNPLTGVSLHLYAHALTEHTWKALAVF